MIGRSEVRRFVLMILALTLVQVEFTSIAQTPLAEIRGVIPPIAQRSFSVAKLEHKISSRITRVEEFQALRQICAELKIRCWLFGGTAAGYAHYVKWDLLRESGDKRFQPDRFDYDYTNIFRSTQDADLVIDGTAVQAEEVEKRLRDLFPHVQGSKSQNGKSVWEVRLLRDARGDKESLLNNPDFLNQHTDSNSTGMVEVTEPLMGDSVVRDVRDWNPAPGKYPIFLEDIHQGKLHYYFSRLHQTTSRFKDGKNPPILSVIRYLTKAFQYELEIHPDDWRAIKKIIDEFEPMRDVTPGYLQTWIEKNGKKIFQHAVNLEYAWNKLEELGLRQKLKQLGSIGKEDSLPWWMSREPLRTSVVSQGTGRTARELNISVVAHETRSFLAYESITRAHTGDPNVFRSRQNAIGESAYHGDGFYTAIGRKGAINSGITIRFTVDPNAREGTDFVLGTSKTTDEGSFVIFKNKAALKVIPESLNIGPVEYFRMRVGSAPPQAIKVDSTDKGMIEKLKRRIRNKFNTISKADLSEVIKIIEGELEQTPLRLEILEEFLSLPLNRFSEGTGARKKTILTVIKALQNPYVFHPDDFYKLLRVPGPEDEDVIRELIVGLKAQDEKSRQRIVGAIGAIKYRDPRIVDSLLRAVEEDPDLVVRTYAAKVLGEVGIADERVIKVLLRVMSEHPHNHLRARAADSLGLLRPDDPRVRQALLRAVKEDQDMHGYVGEAAARALAKTKLSVAEVEVLIKALSEDTRANLRNAAKEALSAFDPEDPAVFQSFREGMKLPSQVSNMEPELISILLKSGAKKTEIFEIFCHALKSADRIVRERASHAVGELGMVDAKTTTLLLNLLEDGDFKIQGNAIVSLGKLRPQDKRVALAIVRHIPSSYWSVGQIASQTLAKMNLKDFEIIHALAETALKHVNFDGLPTDFEKQYEEIRKAIIESLKEIRLNLAADSFEARFIDEYMKAKTHQERLRVFRQARQARAQIPQQPCLGGAMNQFLRP